MSVGEVYASDNLSRDEEANIHFAVYLFVLSMREANIFVLLFTSIKKKRVERERERESEEEIRVQ